MDKDTITIIISLLAILISGWTLWKTYPHLLMERTHKIMDRIYEAQRIIIEYPEIQSVIYREANRKEPYFVDTNDHNDRYFRVKTFIYMQLTIADEYFTIVGNDKGLQQRLEYKLWEDYFIKKMQNPLFRELFYSESFNWGKELNAFVLKNEDEIRRVVVNPEPY